MGFFNKKSSNKSDPKALPPLLQEKAEENLVKGRRTSCVLSEVVPPPEFEEPSEEIIEEPLSYEFFPERTSTIRFDEYDEMQTTIHINDYSNSEIKKTWYKAADYDKMIQSAQKTVRKIEELGEDASAKKGKSKKSAVINSRGLENWTAEGSAKSRLLKDSAVQAVWSEQAIQWDEGTFEPDNIREVYVPFSIGAHKVAAERGKSDAAVYEKALRKKREKEDPNNKRNLIKQSKKYVRKSMKFAGGGVVKTTKMVGEASMYTGKVALEAGKRTTRASIGVATLDPKMLKEAFAVKHHGEEGTGEITRRPSRMNLGINLDDLKSLASSDNSLGGNTPNIEENQKKERLKLLGVVPIPGTQKTYEEDRKAMKIEKRDRAQLARWESSRKMSGKL